MTILDLSSSLVRVRQTHGTYEHQSTVCSFWLSDALELFVALTNNETRSSTGPPGNLAHGDFSPGGIFALVYSQTHA